MNAAKIVRIIGLVVVVVGAFVAITDPYEGVALAIVGLVVGYFVAEADRVLYFAMVIALSIVAGSLGAIPAIGDYLTAILTNLSALLNAGAVTVIAMRIYQKMTE